MPFVRSDFNELEDLRKKYGILYTQVEGQRRTLKSLRTHVHGLLTILTRMEQELESLNGSEIPNPL